jgi:hypothetical protein
MPYLPHKNMTIFCYVVIGHLTKHNAMMGVLKNKMPTFISKKVKFMEIGYSFFEILVVHVIFM